jgi:arsenate reductase
MIRGNVLSWIALLMFVAASTAGAGTASSQGAGAKGRRKQTPQIVFVCEHGAALSVVAAAYFNKLAGERHLNVHAIARGTTPQENISVGARAGLQADGVPFETKQPQALSEADAGQALRIVAFVPIPQAFSKIAPVETWADVSWTGDNYGLARDAILRHTQQLLNELKPEEAKRR